MDTPSGSPIYAAPLYLLRRDHPDPLREGKPHHFWTPWRDEHPRRLPLSLFSDLTFQDEAGTHLPLITRQQSTALAALMLGKLGARTLGKPLSKDLAETIAKVAQSNRYNRKKALEALTDPDAADEYKKLSNDPVFAEFACTVATHLPIVSFFEELPDRKITKLSYISPIDPDESMVKAKLRRVSGVKSEYFAVSINEVSASASHHIEVTLPEHLQLNYIAMTAKEYRSANVPWKDLAPAERACSVRQVGKANSGNIYLSELPFERRMGRVSLKLRTRGTGFMLGALSASFSITLLMLVMAWAAPDILKDSRSEAAAVTLLLLPTVVAAYLARPGEHFITSRMLRWPRAVLLFNGAIPFVAAIAYLTTPQNAYPRSDVDLRMILEYGWKAFSFQAQGVNELQGKWAALAALSVLCTAYFIGRAMWPRPHGKSHYKTRPSKTRRLSWRARFVLRVKRILRQRISG
jgi:hypothetical protein